MNSRTVALTVSLIAATWSPPPLAGQAGAGAGAGAGARKTLSPGTWAGGGVSFTTVESPRDFANGIGLNLVGGITPAGGLGLAGGVLIISHPPPFSTVNTTGAMTQVHVKAGPRYTFNPRAQTTVFVGARALGVLRQYVLNNARRRQYGVGGGGVVGVTGATTIVRVELEVAFDLLSLGDETEEGTTTRESFNSRQFGFSLSFLFPLSTR